MTRHISDIPGPPLRGAGGWGPSLEPPDDEPEDPNLTPNEVRRVIALGYTDEQAHNAKLAAYQAEMERFGAEDIRNWLKRRPAMQRAGVVPPGPPDWPIKPEPTTEDLARRNGMSVEKYVGMQDVHNIADYERLQGELAHKAEVDAEARRRLEVEQAQRRIAAEQSGDEAA
jgi:hypothetical protein